MHSGFEAVTVCKGINFIFQNLHLCWVAADYDLLFRRPALISLQYSES